MAILLQYNMSSWTYYVQLCMPLLTCVLRQLFKIIYPQYQSDFFMYMYSVNLSDSDVRENVL